MLILNVAMNLGLFDGLLTKIYGDTSPLQMSLYTITFTPILLGVLLAYLLHDRRSFEVLYGFAGHRWSPFLFLALLIATCELAPELTKGWARLLLHLNFMLLLSSLVVREDHYARPFLTLAPLARMGVISYGIYLYHMWLIDILRGGLNYFHPARYTDFSCSSWSRLQPSPWPRQVTTSSNSRCSESRRVSRAERTQEFPHASTRHLRICRLLQSLRGSGDGG